MANTNTAIEWTDATWSPVTGCTKVSAGCKHCYAETIANRFWGDRKFIDVQTHPDRLDAPLRWRKPRRVFVSSMSDLFHDDVPDEFIDRVFTVMSMARRHTFQVLTKRPQRMRDYMASRMAMNLMLAPAERWPWPTPNVWLGVSCENQQTADERIPLLLDTPAAVRFLSCEPLLGPIDFKATPQPDLSDRSSTIQWVIVGGESGPGARPCDVAWVRSIVRQCKTAGVAGFVKQLGAYAILDPRYDRSVSGWTRRLRDSKGGDPQEWPEDLRVREFPGVSA